MMLSRPIAIFSQHINQTIMLYALNFYSEVCQVFLNKLV